MMFQIFMTSVEHRRRSFGKCFSVVVSWLYDENQLGPMLFDGWLRLKISNHQRADNTMYRGFYCANYFSRLQVHVYGCCA